MYFGDSATLLPEKFAFCLVWYRSSYFRSYGKRSPSILPEVESSLLTFMFLITHQYDADASKDLLAFLKFILGNTNKFLPNSKNIKLEASLSTDQKCRFQSF